MTEFIIDISSTTDVMYIHVQPPGTKVKSSDTSLTRGVVVDLDDAGNVVGIEFLAVTNQDLMGSVNKIIDKYVSPTYGAPSPLDAVMALRLRHLAQIGWVLK